MQPLANGEVARVVDGGLGAQGAALVSASFELLRFAGLWCITHAPSFFQGVGIP